MSSIPSSPERRPRVWVPLFALIVLMGLPLVWFAASLLVINPVFPLGVSYTNVREASRYLQANPQPRPDSIANFYYIADGYSYSGQKVCVELNMIAPWVQVHKDGFLLTPREASLVTSDQLGFSQKTPHPFVCFPSTYDGEMTHYRLAMAESFNPLSYHVYEWATKGD